MIIKRLKYLPEESIFPVWEYIDSVKRVMVLYHNEDNKTVRHIAFSTTTEQCYSYSLFDEAALNTPPQDFPEAYLCNDNGKTIERIII